MNIDAVGFDLDGTLWNAATVAQRCIQAVIDENDLKVATPSADEMRRIFGLTNAEIAKELFPSLSVTETLRLIDRCCELENDCILQNGGELFDGTVATLEKLSRSYPLYIVSNCQKGYIEAFLKYYGLGDLFCDTECYGNTGLDKGENIKSVLSRNGFINSIYVGDTEWDFQAAKYAGTAFVFAEYGFGKLDGYSPRISSISEITELIVKYETVDVMRNN